jgi:Domain of unknown function (DU1801)
MAEMKTTRNNASTSAFIGEITDPLKRKDCRELMKIMHRITNKRARMWGSSIVGYGSYHYKYESGREGDLMITGFSPRKQNLSIYFMQGFKKYKDLTEKLGKHKLGRSCLFIKKLDDVNRDILETLLTRSVEDMRSRYKCQ